ncbi:fluoride efflux transporter CrcB [Longimicrobium sp.]|uniref:fluoride efflux transporter CrcB n=1 Tax=Longimicrobium sp. TaxID=2029185 RepID=UPI002C66E356|nr:fluoride efflux transporter CrcB [Longimicrobium sp.]HSU16665.1 fluoride efflux transporter CrcB [Longimicrobium sp.]
MRPPPRTPNLLSVALALSHPRTLAPPLLLLYLAAGGVAGTLARYGLGKWIPTWAGTDFPWHTLIINLAGSFVLGFAVRASETMPVSPEVRGMVTIGFCGAFTTFSTFSLETVALLQDGQWGRGMAYALGSVAAGLVAILAGMAAAGAAFRPRL